MAIETKLNLEPETIEKLQELVQLNIDSRDGFEYAASKLENMSIVGLFEQLAMERRQQADELARFIEYNGEDAERTGSYSAALHRTWMAIREGLSGDGDYAVLAEAERGEDTIKNAYEEALKCGCGGAMNDVLMHQYAAVKAAHDRVRDLRDSLAES